MIFLFPRWDMLVPWRVKDTLDSPLLPDFWLGYVRRIPAWSSAWSFLLVALNWIAWVILEKVCDLAGSSKLVSTHSSQWQTLKVWGITCLVGKIGVYGPQLVEYVYRVGWSTRLFFQSEKKLWPIHGDVVFSKRLSTMGPMRYTPEN